MQKIPSPKPSIIVIVGPTASGKSELAVKIAKKVGGEIISADSRQVYRGLNIGTGKVEGVWTLSPLSHRERAGVRVGQNIKDQKSTCPPEPWRRREIKSSNQNSKLNPQLVNPLTRNKKIFVYKSIPHHCIDFVSPKKQYTVADFKRDASKAIKDIQQRGKIPIVCGGTGHYIDALIFDQNIPDIPPDEKLRKQMEKKSAEELFSKLQKLDPVRASNIDRFNKRRLIRALEIIKHTGKPVPLLPLPLGEGWGEGREYPVVNLKPEIIHLSPLRSELYKKIEKRLGGRIKSGMLEEVALLHKNGLSWKRMHELGLEYRFVAEFLKSLNGNLETKNLRKLFINSSHYQTLLQEIKNYSKRQETWFRKTITRLQVSDSHNELWQN